MNAANEKRPIHAPSDTVAPRACHRQYRPDPGRGI